jgi:hypothetical protein
MEMEVASAKSASGYNLQGVLGLQRRVAQELAPRVEPRQQPRLAHGAAAPSSLPPPASRSATSRDLVRHPSSDASSSVSHSFLSWRRRPPRRCSRRRRPRSGNRQMHGSPRRGRFFSAPAPTPSYLPRWGRCLLFFHGDFLSPTPAAGTWHRRRVDWAVVLGRSRGGGVEKRQ